MLGFWSFCLHLMWSVAWLWGCRPPPGDTWQGEWHHQLGSAKVSPPFVTAHESACWLHLQGHVPACCWPETSGRLDRRQPDAGCFTAPGDTSPSDVCEVKHSASKANVFQWAIDLPFSGLIYNEMAQEVVQSPDFDCLLWEMSAMTMINESAMSMSCRNLLNVFS